MYSDKKIFVCVTNAPAACYCKITDKNDLRFIGLCPARDVSFLTWKDKKPKRESSLLLVCIMSQKCQENKVVSKTKERKSFFFLKKSSFLRYFRKVGSLSTGKSSLIRPSPVTHSWRKQNKIIPVCKVAKDGVPR